MGLLLLLLLNQLMISYSRRDILWIGELGRNFNMKILTT